MRDSQHRQLATLERIIAEEIHAKSLPVELRRLWQAGEVEERLCQLVRRTRRAVVMFLYLLSAFWAMAFVVCLRMDQIQMTLSVVALTGFISALHAAHLFAFPLRSLSRLEQMQLHYRVLREELATADDKLTPIVSAPFADAPAAN